MYSTNTRSEFLSLRLEFVEKRYVLLCALEMDAAVKRLPLLWTKVHFKLYLGACTHTLLQNPFRELLHSFCSCQLQIFWPGSFLHWHEPKLREKMLQKARLLPLLKPDCSDTVALSHASSTDIIRWFILILIIVSPLSPFPIVPKWS